MTPQLIAEPPAPSSSSPVSAPPAPPHGGQSASPTPWIFGPWVDLIVGCGAWSAPLLALAFYASNAHARAWTIAFYFLALLCNYPHFMATVYRAYHTHSEFAKYRIFTLQTALLLLAAGIAAHLWYPLLPWIFTLYICWSPWHYTGQNFGLLMMFARRSAVVPTPLERRALRLAFAASFVMLMLSFHTGASADPMVLSLGLPTKFTLPARAALAMFFFAATLWAFGSMLQRAKSQDGLRSAAHHLFPSMVLAATQFLWFLLPAMVELATRHDVPQTRYSSGLLAVLHSTQYLWITSYYQRREARAAGNLSWKFSSYLLTLIAGGIALFIPGPWLVSRLFHADFAASFLTFTALVNIHHFILDGALWKLRDSRVSTLLLSNAESKSNAKSNVVVETGKSAPESRVVFAFRWFASATPAACAIRVAAVIALFAVAALDQLHFYWFNRADNLPALQRAAALNPHDSAVQLRLARAEAAIGQRDAELVAAREAARLNPWNVSAQETLSRALLEQGRSDEAYAQYRFMLDHWPSNTDALVDYGLLARQRGNDAEAIDSWQRAIAIDPAQLHAQLYLAQALEQQGEPQAAANHYRAYLQLALAHPAEHHNDAPALLVALLKVADADAAANRFSDAQLAYTSSARLAATIGDHALESLALEHLADTQEKSGDIVSAADSHQRALRADAASSDSRSAAADWLNYAQFLRRHHQPEELVFASLLHAEQLLLTTPSDELGDVVQARQQSQSRLGLATATVRANEDSVLQKALSLSPSEFSAQK
jgi:tetratricopeptide (TPR) repeat protein